jgi:divalent metal cation (Fe/Co/Zn/Cd) transporter
VRDPLERGSADSASPWVRRAIGLLILTAAYNFVEAGVAVWAGIEAHSIALVGFGFDAVIELAASLVVLWRFRVESTGGGDAEVEYTEGLVRRFVGLTFFLLAAYVVAEAGARLWSREAAEGTTVGIALAVASLIIMPVLSVAKLRVARALGSRALEAEAKETLVCAYLSFALLLGLAANAWAGWWWADPAAALVMVPWLIREGRESFGAETHTPGERPRRGEERRGNGDVPGRQAAG